MPRQVDHEVTYLPIEQIVIARRRQRSVCPGTVERYRQLLEAGSEPPAIQVCSTLAGTWAVRDGRHRLLAARAAGHVVVAAVAS